MQILKSQNTSAKVKTATKTQSTEHRHHIYLLFGRDTTNSIVTAPKTAPALCKHSIKHARKQCTRTEENHNKKNNKNNKYQQNTNGIY